MMTIDSAETIFLFVMYLWVILGNGFRYGTRYLYVSLAVGLVGFTFAVTQGEDWQNPLMQDIGISMLFVLFLIPMYSAFLIKKLHSAIDDAKIANQAKSRFLANMSHELRTPLNGVIGVSDLMGETPLNNEQKSLIKIMRSSANSLLGLIENVLDISKIEAGKIEISYSQFDLHDFIQQIVRMQAPLAESKALKLSYHFDSAVDFEIEADHQHLRQILINLIGNAIKFTESGFIHLSVERVYPERDKQWIRFEVKDTGIGIPEDALANIFDDFRRVHHTGEHFSGTGLGTTISKELVELMGGEIGVQSQLSEGSTFWFELPLKTVKLTPKPLEKQHVLVISEPTIFNALDTMMATWGMSSEFADNTTLASAKLINAVAQNQPFTTVLVDFQLIKDVPPVSFAEMIKSDSSLDELSLILFNLPSHEKNDTLDRHYISSISGIPSKTGLFNALHLVNASSTNNENITRLSDYFSEGSVKQSLKVLVAEDNKVNQHVLKGILEHGGHNVIITESGDEALETLSQDEGGIDILILDMNLPDYSGDQILHSLSYMEKKTHSNDHAHSRCNTRS
jgi:two-component system sensor histidine kinase RpfC